jgi:hypothetical protein
VGINYFNMAFIDKADYADSINNNILDGITTSDDDKLDKAEKKAIDFMKGYLSSRYDVDNIFNKTGDDRHPVVLMYAIHITLYYIHSLIPYNKIPVLRKEQYE